MCVLMTTDRWLSRLIDNTRRKTEENRSPSSLKVSTACQIWPSDQNRGRSTPDWKILSFLNSRNERNQEDMVVSRILIIAGPEITA